MNKELLKFMLGRTMNTNLLFAAVLTVWSWFDIEMIPYSGDAYYLFYYGAMVYAFLLTRSVFFKRNIAESAPYIRGFSRDTIWWHALLSIVLSYLLVVGISTFSILLPIREFFISLRDVGDFVIFRPLQDSWQIIKISATIFWFIPLFIYCRIRKQGSSNESTLLMFVILSNSSVLFFEFSRSTFVAVITTVVLLVMIVFSFKLHRQMEAL